MDVDLLLFLPVDEPGVMLGFVDFLALVGRRGVSSSSCSGSLSSSESSSRKTSALSLSGDEEEQQEANVLV